MTAIERMIVQPSEGRAAAFGGFGVVWKIDGSETAGNFSVVEHSIAPRTLTSPLHFHHNEDEYSYVLEGMLGAVLGDEVVLATPGSWVFKPRGEWHALWNAADRTCRIIELTSPAGFESYYREVAAIFEDAGPNTPDLDRLATVNQRYGVEMDFDSVSELCPRFGLTHPLMDLAARPAR